MSSRLWAQKILYSYIGICQAPASPLHYHNFMPVDPKYLREQYASLSDDALRAINRADLVEAAQRCYDDEVARRRAARHENPEADSEPLDNGDKPDWLEDAAAVFSRVDRPGALPAND